MELNNIKRALETYQKGSFIRCSWQSRIESVKARKMGIEVLKISEATVRLGIKYSNIKAVQIMRENQEGEQKVRNIWFKHDEQIPAIIQHLQDEEKKYLQIFTVNKGAAPKVKYLLNGSEISLEELKKSGYCNSSAFDKGETLTFNIPIENLRFIGNYN